MARPLRIEFPGALYYISSAGNGGNNIFKDSQDGSLLLDALDGVCARFKWRCFSYCFMSDGYHLIVENHEANLSKGMRQLNGIYTQSYNRHHNTGGHVFQGRFKSIFIQKDKFLIPLIKEIFLFPLKSGFVKHPSQFKWSSCKYLYGKEKTPDWIENGWFDEKNFSLEKFDSFLMDGDETNILKQIKKQIFLGDDDFISYVQSRINQKNISNEIPKTQITKPVSKTYAEILSDSESKNEAIAKTYLTGKYSLKEIGEYVGIHYSGISKIVSEFEKKV
ncbi:MAG: transposase [Thermodesulfobacteriota bacterium]